MVKLFKRLIVPTVSVACLGASLQGADQNAGTTKNGRLNVRLVNQNEEPAAPMPDPSLDAAPDANASLLSDQRQMIILQTQKLRNEVSNAVEAARQLDPDAALAGLKQALGAVKSAIDIAPEDRQQMQKRLESEILSQENQKDVKQQALVRALELRAQNEARQRLADQAMLDEERLENLIDRVRSLMQEGRHGRDEAYAEAQLVADVAIDMRPGEGASTAARFDAESAHQLESRKN
eukprot:TRINITY_DN34112_c0_g2_i1.p1 TRINITY_DN34112_c0_g2~~TRINITY_DN34112_c0_g2_i1.p1  ORF type:complete len:236 (+),score=25.08 TRINITY_DN34112_c0_g2_i1:86-793(+)